MADEAAGEWLSKARQHAEMALEACIHCGLCRAACVSHRALKDPRFTPEARIEAAARILLRGETRPGDLEKLYTCSMCGACTAVCPYGIETWRLVHAARMVLSEKGLQPKSLEEVKRNAERSGHSFTPDPRGPREMLVKVAAEAGVTPNEPGSALYVPSPFETTLYPNVLRDALRLLRSQGIEVMVSTRTLDLGGNAAIDAAGLAEGLKLFEAAVEEAERLGAREVILSGCGADAKLASLARELGLKTRLRFASIYEKIEPRGIGGDCSRCLLFPSCGFGRFEADKFPFVKRQTEAGLPRDKPPFTMCCGGGGGLNYLREKPLALLRDRVVSWRAKSLARQADRIITPCIKCYTVIKYGLVKARMIKGKSVEHLVTHVSRRAIGNK